MKKMRGEKWEGESRVERGQEGALERRKKEATNPSLKLSPDMTAILQH